jgi:hypothetical protein
MLGRAESALDADFCGVEFSATDGGCGRRAFDEGGFLVSLRTPEMAGLYVWRGIGFERFRE